jgi:hypothetical protein
LFTRAYLALHVNLTGRVFAYQNSSQVRNFAAARPDLIHFGGQFGFDVFGKEFPVEYSHGQVFLTGAKLFNTVRVGNIRMSN